MLIGAAAAAGEYDRVLPPVPVQRGEVLHQFLGPVALAVGDAQHPLARGAELGELRWRFVSRTLKKHK